MRYQEKQQLKSVTCLHGGSVSGGWRMRGDNPRLCRAQHKVECFICRMYPMRFVLTCITAVLSREAGGARIVLLSVI